MRLSPACWCEGEAGVCTLITQHLSARLWELLLKQNTDAAPLSRNVTENKARDPKPLLPVKSALCFLLTCVLGMIQHTEATRFQTRASRTDVVWGQTCDSYYQFIREKINDAAARPSHVCKKTPEETCGVKTLESPETECTIYSPTVLVCKLWGTSLDCLNVKPLYTPSEFQFQVCFQMMLIVSGDRRWTEEAAAKA